MLLLYDIELKLDEDLKIVNYKCELCYQLLSIYCIILKNQICIIIILKKGFKTIFLIK